MIKLLFRYTYPTICFSVICLKSVSLRDTAVSSQKLQKSVLDTDNPYQVACLTPPLCAISCKALPGHSVDVDSLHVSYADIFISQVRTAGGSPAQIQLTVEDAFWNAPILHTTDMIQPSQSALSKQSVNSGKNSTRQDISIGYFILPAYSRIRRMLLRWNVLSLLSVYRHIRMGC